jgi:hypothetical protein
LNAEKYESGKILLDRYLNGHQNREEDVMELEPLKKIKEWSSLNDIGLPYHNLGDVLYKLYSQIYVIAVPYNKSFITDERIPYVTLLMWAQTDGAAKRSELMEIKADIKENNDNPPSEMLPPNGAETYGDIINELKKGYYGEFYEHADYRIAKDGAFIQRVIETLEYKFCFRKNDNDNSEIPYVIIYKLKP